MLELAFFATRGQHWFTQVEQTFNSKLTFFGGKVFILVCFEEVTSYFWTGVKLVNPQNSINSNILWKNPKTTSINKIVVSVTKYSFVNFFSDI